MKNTILEKLTVAQIVKKFLTFHETPKVQYCIYKSSPSHTIPKQMNATLTLKRLMSYIYMEHPFLMFLDHTQRRSTVGRTPLDE